MIKFSKKLISEIFVGRINLDIEKKIDKNKIKDVYVGPVLIWTANKKVAMPTVRGEYTYNKEVQYVQLDNFSRDKLIVEGDLYATNAGIYTIKLTPQYGCCWDDEGLDKSSKYLNWEIKKADPNIVVDTTELTVEYSRIKTRPISSDSIGLLIISSSIEETATATIENNSTIYVKGENYNNGIASTITITSLEEENYLEASKSFIANTNRRIIQDNEIETKNSNENWKKDTTRNCGVISSINGLKLEKKVGDNWELIIESCEKGVFYELGTRSDAGQTIIEYKFSNKNFIDYVRTATININRAPVGNKPTNINKIYNSKEQSIGYSFEYVESSGTFTGTNIGTYTSYYTPDNNHCWNDETTDTAEASLIINPLNILGAEITLDNYEFVYNNIERQVNILSVKLDDILVNTYTSSGLSATDAGEYTVNVTGESNFTGTASKNWNIYPLDISDFTVNLGDSLTYNGLEQTQSVISVIKDNLFATYIITNNSGTESGKYTLTCTGTNNYTGAVDKEWIINRLSLSGASIELKEFSTYTGEIITQEINKIIVQGLTPTYTVSGNTAKDAGNYQLICTGTNNFKDNIAAQWSIYKATAIIEEDIRGLALSYTGENQQIHTAGKGVGVDGLQINMEYSENIENWSTAIILKKEIGTYNINYRAQGNNNHYNSDYRTASSSIKITKITIPTISSSSFTYNKAEQGPTIYSEHSSFINQTGIIKATDAGEYTITWSLKDPIGTNWSDGTTANKSAIWKINKASGYISTEPTIKSLTYNGSNQTLVNAGSGTGTMYYSLSSSSGFSTSIPTGKDAKDYTVYYYSAENNNYTQSSTKNIKVTINKKSISGADITLSSNLVAYTGSQRTISVSSISGVSNPTFTTSGNTGTNEGVYSVTAIGTGNFTGTTASASWRIANVLYFTANIAGSTIALNKKGTPTKNQSFQYSTDGYNWSAYTPNNSITLQTNGSKVYFKATNTNSTVSEDYDIYYYFSMSGSISAYGNIMSLLDQTCQSKNISTSYCFYDLFYRCSSLLNAPILPATTLSDSCYSNMFYGTSITTAPVLSATTLATDCYKFMFGYCATLTNAPALPATTLADNCYESMFYECTSLVTPPALPATTLANYCYYNMFFNCSALASAPELKASTLKSNCYSYMFRWCESLKTPPSLPALTLAEKCYSSMFMGCSALTSTPTLSATKLYESCYSNMFNGCSSLTSVSALPATTLAYRCYYGMFSYCTSLTTTPSFPNTNITLADECCNSMFRGCSSLTTANTIYTDKMFSNCYTYMFKDCTSLKTAPSLPATTMNESCYAYMFEGCIKLISPPTLPATNMKYMCYYSMFSGCTSLSTAPSLPATTLDELCYTSMFYGCTGLSIPPALPSTELKEDCYYLMFYGCTSLCAYESSGTGHTVVWKIPSTGNSSGNYTMYNMFYNCKGATTSSRISPKFYYNQLIYYTYKTPV